MKRTIPESMTQASFLKAIKIRPLEVLTSNSKLKKDGIWNLSIPAYKATIAGPNGAAIEFTTCPSASKCLSYCYANGGGQGGTYAFGKVLVKHTRNLQWMIDDPFAFTEKVVKEIGKKKHLRAIRFNDSGDIWGEGYWGVIKALCKECPDVQFYAYTKQIVFVLEKQNIEGEVPKNLTIVFSYGGKNDSLINPSIHRHSKVFESRAALRAEGYSDGTHTDRLAANPNILKIGLVVHGNHLSMNKYRKLVRHNNMKAAGV
jgi:hypothetical protein